jgi:hypothetical protein
MLTMPDPTAASATSAPANGWAQKLHQGWIVSLPFDALLLVFAPLVTLPIIAGVYYQIPLLAIGGGMMLAFAHYSSTLSFFLWQENRTYHRSRWVAFYVGPIVITVVYLSLLGFQVPYLIQFVLFFWNTFHVARQNNGILSLYRQRAGVANPVQRNSANYAILSISLFLAVWNIDTHREVTGLLGWFGDGLNNWLRVVAGLVALFFLFRLAFALYRRQESMGIPETLFLLASLLFFYPYLFIKDSGIATFAMLLPHYVQYMALVWLLHRRKFAGATGGAPPLLRLVSGRLVYLIPMLAAIGFFFYFLKGFMDSNSYAYGFESLYLFIAFLHFYMDGLIWSFKRPHVRKSMLPFLLPQPPGAKGGGGQRG